MGKPLQILLAVTCIAVLAVIGYLAWKELGPSAEPLTAVPAAATSLPREKCLEVVRNRNSSTDIEQASQRQAYIQSCVDSGYITYGELD